MMGITTCGDVGLDAPLLTSRQRRRTKVASVQFRRIWSTNLGRDGRQRGFGFLTIVGMIGEGPSHDEQTRLIHGHLRVVILLEASMRRAFHDARLRVRLGKDTARCIPFEMYVSASSPPNPACKLSLHRALHHP